MTSDIDGRQPYSHPTHLTILKLIKREMTPWLTKAELVHLQNRSRYKQLAYKSHQRFNNPGALSVWKRRSYISSEVMN